MQNKVLSGHAAERLLDLNDLRIFAYVASLASFSLAADALQIHKSSVSRSIARLEVMLQASLIQRTTRKVLLTPRGVDLKERCIEMLSRVNETIGHAGTVHAQPQALGVRSRTANLSRLNAGAVVEQRRRSAMLGAQARAKAGRTGAAA